MYIRENAYGIEIFPFREDAPTGLEASVGIIKGESFVRFNWYDPKPDKEKWKQFRAAVDKAFEFIEGGYIGKCYQCSQTKIYSGEFCDDCTEANENEGSETIF
jgi:hypothetical protein